MTLVMRLLARRCVVHVNVRAGGGAIMRMQRDGPAILMWLRRRWLGGRFPAESPRRRQQEEEAQQAGTLGAGVPHGGGDSFPCGRRGLGSGLPPEALVAQMQGTAAAARGAAKALEQQEWQRWRRREHDEPGQPLVSRGWWRGLETACRGRRRWRRGTRTLLPRIHRG